jgi:hypothetical protein
MNMNRKQIEEEMKRITEEGRQLQEKLLIIEALKECKEKGHDVIQSELDMNFYGATRADFVCRRCTAQLFLSVNDNDDGGVWYWSNGPFSGKPVADVYEEEEEEPAPELEPNFDAERKQNMTFPPPSQEETQTGAYRVDTSSMFKSRDHNVEY